jgi:predicted TIM-barrel enzyme
MLFGALALEVDLLALAFILTVDTTIKFPKIGDSVFVGLGLRIGTSLPNSPSASVRAGIAYIVFRSDQA